MSTAWLVLIVVGAMAVAAFLGALIGYPKGWDDCERHRGEIEDKRAARIAVRTADAAPQDQL